MPRTTPTTTSSSAATTDDYFRALPPTWDTLQKSLAIFAVVVILRSCIRRLWVLLRSHKASHSSTLPADHRHTVGRQSATRVNHFQPYRDQRYRHAPPPWQRDSDSTLMDEKNDRNVQIGAVDANNVSPDASDAASSPDARKPPPTPLEQRWRQTGSDGVLRYLITRPPPAPPLTPPELSSSIFTLEGRPHSQDTFIHQPNPDYASSSTQSSGSHPSTVDTTAHARRFSYTRTVPIGIPPKPSASRTSGGDLPDADLKFAPSSYPPTSPNLPPPAPTNPGAALGSDSPGRNGGGAGEEQRREIDLQGQIVSVLDREGTGWSRHTRVYGGGVCLACQAAGLEHGAGGFYGATVTPEEMMR